MMTTARDMIADQIAQQHEIQGHLLELSKRQAAVLRRGDPEALKELNSIVTEQQEAILRLGRINREWMTTLPSIASSLNLGESVTLSELIDALPAEERDDLLAKASEMRGIIESLREQNTRNMEVIAFEAKLDDHFMREIVLQPVVHPNSDIAHQPRLVDVEA